MTALRLALAVGLAGSLVASTAGAVPLILLPTEQSQTQGFFGLSLPLGKGGPRIEFGLRRSTVTSGGDLSGTEVKLSVNPRDPADLRLRLSALSGDTRLAGSLGLGWDFGTGQPFASAGIVGPYLSGAADFGLGGLNPQFQIGLNSLGQADTPAPKVWNGCNAPFLSVPTC